MCVYYTMYIQAKNQHPETTKKTGMCAKAHIERINFCFPFKPFREQKKTKMNRVFQVNKNNDL